MDYWPRYIARLLQVSMEYRGELQGWRMSKPRVRGTNPIWVFGEHWPWNLANRLHRYPYPVRWKVENEHSKLEKKTRIMDAGDPEDWLFFKGDRVKVLVGPDRGRVGIVVGILPLRRLCIVEGLNCRHVTQRGKDGKPQISKSEMPLSIDTDVRHIDPFDNEETEIAWRYTETGERVRVSLRTGKIVPIAKMAAHQDDLVNPSDYLLTPRDTDTKLALKLTYQPTLKSFDEEVLERAGVRDTRKRQPKFWY